MYRVPVQPLLPEQVGVVGDYRTIDFPALDDYLDGEGQVKPLIGSESISARVCSNPLM